MPKTKINKESADLKAQGFIKIFETDKITGKTKTLVDKPNTILYSGADLLAYALTGFPGAFITHMYLGYDNTTSGSFTPPVVSKDPSVNPFSAYSAGNTPPDGYLRIPLAFPASFIATPSYLHNIPVFTAMVTSSAPVAQGGVAFVPSGSTSSWIFEIALVSAIVPADPTQDVIFSRATFTPIQYNNVTNLTFSWGVQFTA